MDKGVEKLIVDLCYELDIIKYLLDKEPEDAKVRLEKLIQVFLRVLE